jgi:hypothetical protein
MAQRNLFLRGAASLALIFGMLSAPANAQDEASDTAAYDAAVSQYNNQLKDYQDKAAAYERQRQAYQAQAETYNARTGIYGDRVATYADRVTTYADAPAADVTIAPRDRVVIEDRYAPPADRVVIAPAPRERVVLGFPAGHDRLLDIDALRNPDRELAGMPIEDRFGNLVGHFRRLSIQDGGREKAVLTLHNNKSVAVEEDHLRFDPNRSMVVADLSYDQLNRYPARF